MELRLIAHEGKHGITYWQATSRQQIDAAMRALFDLLDSQGCYHDQQQDLGGRPDGRLHGHLPDSQGPPGLRVREMGSHIRH